MIFLFDLDDTLLDDLAAKNHYMPKLYNHFQDRIKFDADEFCVKWRKAVFKYHIKYTNGEMTFEEQRSERVREAFGDPKLPDIVIADVVTAFDKYFKEGWKSLPHTIEILEYLKEFRKGIITNGSIKQQNEKIDVLGIRKYFECIMISEEEGVSKPDVRIFRKACEKLNCFSSQCFFIGDSWETDIEGSHKSGMNPIWFNRYGKEIPKQLKNVTTISGLEEIKQIIN